MESLNEKLWDGETLKREVRTKLLNIASDFCKENGISDDTIDDIIITGSLANYNWSNNSDIDLHIVVDTSKVDADKKILGNFYRSIKFVWNSNHNIEICGYEVEIYVQDASEDHYSAGVYSLNDDKWVTKPSKNAATNPSQAKIYQKTSKFVSMIDGANTLKQAQTIKNKIKQMRVSALKNKGELSLDNLVFKSLRNKGYLDKLSNKILSLYDDSHTSCPMEGSEDSTFAIGNPAPRNDAHDIAKALYKIKMKNENSMTLDQKLERVFKTTERADQMAKLAVRSYKGLELEVKRGFEQVHQALEKLAGGQKLVDEPGESIWDE